MANVLLQFIKDHRPPVNFIILHYVYFIATSLLCGIILWASATPARSISFTDALFLAVSAMTEAGLNTINLSVLNTFQQILLFILIIMGSQVGVSATVIYIRRRAFEKKFTHIVEEDKKSRISRTRSFDTVLRRRRDTKPLTITRTSAKAEVDGIVVRGRRISFSEAKDAPDTVHNNELDDLGRAKRENDLASPRSQGDDLHGPNTSPPASTNQDTAANSQNSTEPLPNLAVLDPRSTIRFAEGEGPQNSKNPTLLASVPVSSTSAVVSPRRGRLLSMSGVGARNDLRNHPKNAPPPSPFLPSLHTHDSARPSGQNHDFALWTRSGLSRYLAGIAGRNAHSSAVDGIDRDKLGGVEYRALKLLEVLVTLYFVLFQILGAVGVGTWTAVNSNDVAVNNGLNSFWVGAFNAVSAFNNSGMSLLDANMVAFQSSQYVLLTMSLLILAGNTCYPIILRLICWCAWKLVPKSEDWVDTKVALRFILDHPRRVYTHLFPAYHTLFLLGSVCMLNAVDWVGFEVLNIGNPYVESLASNTRVLAGLFQAFAVRSGGFYVVPIASIAVGVQVLYVIMMYISVYPVTITMRSSNVYEERSLGIYATPHGSESLVSPATQQPRNGGRLEPLRRHLTNATLFAETGSRSKSYFVKQQVQSQLAHDLWWICLAVWLVIIIEGSQFASDPIDYSVFNVIFEIVSAYGTVGISIGLPNAAYSFCGDWHVLSKLILCAVMLRGRHRGLPVAIDRAVLLPHESLGYAEEEDARIRAAGIIGDISSGEVLRSPSYMRV